MAPDDCCGLRQWSAAGSGLQWPAGRHALAHALAIPRPLPRMTAAQADRVAQTKSDPESVMADMSVSISPNGGDRTTESSARKSPAAANASDLDLWLEKIEAMGEL